MESLKRLESIAPVGKAFSLLDEFKSFALKGNVVDLAVAVIVGGAFGKIVDSLVKNVFMPLISSILPGDGGYQKWTATVNGVEIQYGQFLGEVVNFVIVALALFLFVVKFLGLIVRTKKAEPPKPTKDQELLTEIRDLLKAQQTPNTNKIG